MSLDEMAGHIEASKPEGSGIDWKHKTGVQVKSKNLNKR